MNKATISMILVLSATSALADNQQGSGTGQSGWSGSGAMRESDQLTATEQQRRKEEIQQTQRYTSPEGNRYQGEGASKQERYENLERTKERTREEASTSDDTSGERMREGDGEHRERMQAEQTNRKWWQFWRSDD